VISLLGISALSYRVLTPLVWNWMAIGPVKSLRQLSPWCLFADQSQPLKEG